jgi:hypothetical protein
MSPLIAVPDHIARAGLMRLHALYTGLSRRGYVSINWRA